MSTSQHTRATFGWCRTSVVTSGWRLPGPGQDFFFSLQVMQPPTLLLLAAAGVALGLLKDSPAVKRRRTLRLHLRVVPYRRVTFGWRQGVAFGWRWPGSRCAEGPCGVTSGWCRNTGVAFGWRRNSGVAFGWRLPGPRQDLPPYSSASLVSGWRRLLIGRSASTFE